MGGWRTKPAPSDVPGTLSLRRPAASRSLLVDAVIGPPPSTAGTGGETSAATQPGFPDVREHRLPVSRAAPERALRKLEMYNRLAELVAAEPVTEDGTLRRRLRVVGDRSFRFVPVVFGR